MDLVSFIQWDGAFGILRWQDRRVSIIRIRSDEDTNVDVFSAMLEGSSGDPVTLIGEDALSRWLRDCFARRH